MVLIEDHGVVESLVGDGAESTSTYGDCHGDRCKISTRRLIDAPAKDVRRRDLDDDRVRLL